MPGPVTRGVLRARSLLALATVALAVSATLGATLAPGAQAATSTTVTFTPGRISFGGADLANVMRGQYVWSGQAAQPAGSPASDTYYRDQVMWSQIEPTPGTYDFHWFDNGLADAASRGGRFGFRVMAWCPGCFRSATPSWMPLQAGTDIPDWDDPVFLQRWSALMKELSSRYGSDPRLGWMDVGGYGKYGEWHNDLEGAEATPATLRQIISTVFTSFPHQHVVLNAMNTEGIKQALALSPRIGFRMDCLGLSDFFYPFDHSTALRDRWKTAPVVSEWCHTPSASTVTGAAQVTRYHVSLVSSGNTISPYASMSSGQQAGWRAAVKHAGYRYQLRRLTLPRKLHSGRAFTAHATFADVGSAPTYDDWRVELRLLDATGTVRASTPMGVDLRTVRPGRRAFARSLTTTLAPGSYRVAVAVVDPTGYLRPMRLATRGRLADGSYGLGTIRVVR